jgi:thioredoxin-related protein
MEKLTIEKIKAIKRNCNKTTCGWCVLVKRRIWTEKTRIGGAWCPYFEQFIKDLKEGEDWRETKLLPECIAACKIGTQQHEIVKKKGKTDEC